MNSVRNTAGATIAAAAKQLLRGSLVAMSLAACSNAFADNPYAVGIDAALEGDYRTAAGAWTQLAAENDGRAQFQLGLLYHAGLYVDRSEEIAVRLYHSAAKNGVREAQEYLAIGYANGWFGLPQDDHRADYWLARSERRPLNQIAQR